MFDFIKKLFSGTSIDFPQLLANGAQIIDVRTPAEFSGGHIQKSKNIPLQQLKGELKNLDRNKPVITCCASGMRSSSAKAILEQEGFEVYNGGGWSSLNQKLTR